ncbi:hypothetical protein, partial [Salmonella enterica]|uniref:hypothetical protein n=1 Tax=Salmonella enterica TaxID=28901 RepID=UPI001C1EE0EF
SKEVQVHVTTSHANAAIKEDSKTAVVARELDLDTRRVIWTMMANSRAVHANSCPFTKKLLLRRRRFWSKVAQVPVTGNHANAAIKEDSKTADA